MADSGQLTFYFRQGCHLCDEMWQHLLELQRDRGIEIEIVEVDVDSSEALKERFGTLVPVLTAGDRILCNYYLNPVALSDYLEHSTVMAPVV